MLVKNMMDVARGRLLTVKRHDTLITAAKLLRGTQISLLVACDDIGKMAGVITKSDVIGSITSFHDGTPRVKVEEIMTQDVLSCRLEESIKDVLALMQSRGFIHLPVIDDDCFPIGVITARDTIAHLLANEKFDEALMRNYVLGVGYR